MSNSTDPFDAAVASPSRSNNKLLWLKHGVYALTVFLWEYCTGPRKPIQPKNKDSQFKFIAERLISTLPDNPDQLTVETTKQLLGQHRTIENTQARRRLERWACWAIVVYLACVFLLLIFNGISRILWPDIFTANEPLFSDSVLYVILSTTTVNILGLGFIVLKGHFPQKEDKSHADSTDAD